jgi:hypothetical protein
MFAGFECGQRRGSFAVKPLEECIHLSGDIRISAIGGPARINGINERRRSIPDPPEKTSCIELENLVIVNRIQAPQKALGDQQGHQRFENDGVIARAEIVALVPRRTSPGAAQRSLRRRISMATSAPCLPRYVCVKLVQYEEPQTTANPVEKALILRANEHELGHHVIGQHDLRWILPHALARDADKGGTGAPANHETPDWFPRARFHARPAHRPSPISRRMG